MVQLSSRAASAFAYRAGAAPPCSEYFRCQWAKGKPREPGRLGIPDQSFPDAGHSGGLKEYKLYPWRATREDIHKTAQLRTSSQQWLNLKVGTKPGFLSFSAASFAPFPLQPLPLYLSLQPALLFPVDQLELWLIPHFILKLRTMFNPLTSPSSC